MYLRQIYPEFLISPTCRVGNPKFASENRTKLFELHAMMTEICKMADILVVAPKPFNTAIPGDKRPNFAVDKGFATA